MEDLTQDQWTNQLANDNKAVVLDVRTDIEISEEGSLPDAKHIDIYKGQDFLDEVEALDKTKNYYIYCRFGNRSSQACGIMSQLGFENTYNLLGGFSEWDGEVTNI